MAQPWKTHSDNLMFFFLKKCLVALRAIQLSAILFGISPKGFVCPDNSLVLLFCNKQNIAPEVTAIRIRPHATAIPATAPVLTCDFPPSAGPETR